MGIGPQDYIDELLVQKYAEKQVNNLGDLPKLTMSTDRYWEVMKDYAQMQRMMFAVRGALSKPKVAKPVPVRVTA